MNIDKRLSYIITTLLYVGVSAFLYVFNLVNYRGALLLSFAVFFVAGYFIAFKSLQRIRYIGLLSLAIISFLYFFTSLNTLFVIIYITATAFGFYLNLLALNIYNISEKTNKPLPLLQAAKLVIFIALILIVFLCSTVIYKINFSYVGGMGSTFIQLVLFSFLYLALFNSIIEWFFSEDKIGELKTRNILVSIGSLRTFAVLYLSQLSLVLMFTRLEDFGRGLFLAANTYVLVNFIQVIINRTLNKRFFIESISILLVIYILI